MQVEFTRIHSDVFADRLVLLQDRLPFTNRDNVFVGGKWEQITKTPDAAVVQGIMAIRPAGFEFTQGLGDRKFVPFVIDIEQTSTIGTRCHYLGHIKCGSTKRGNASLKGIHESSTRWVSIVVCRGRLLCSYIVVARCRGFSHPQIGRGPTFAVTLVPREAGKIAGVVPYKSPEVVSVAASLAVQ